MKFWLECKIGGSGESFAGTLHEAVTHARTLIRGKGFRQIVWHGTHKMAEVWEDGEWITRLDAQGRIA